MTLTSNLGHLTATTEIDKTGLTRDMQAVRELLNAERLSVRIDTSALGGPSVSIERLTVGIGDLTAKLEALSRRAPIKMPDVERISSEAATAARGVSVLTSQLQRGTIDTATYDQRTKSLIATLQNGAAQAGKFSREAAMLEGNLLKVAKIQVKPQLSPMDKAYWQAIQEDSRRTAAAVAAQWKTEMATARQAVTRAMNLRQDWQGGSVGDTAALERLNAMRQGYQQTQTAIQGQIDKLQQLGVLDEQQTKRVQVLEQQYRAYGNAVRNLGSIEASIQGTIQKGSLADSMSRGITASAQQATEALRLLQAQEQAGIITKRELATALNGEVSSLRGSILATQQKAAGLRNLGVLDAQQTTELGALTRAEITYTEALARTIAAQHAAAQSSSVMRQGMSAAGVGGGRLNNAALAASFISPEAGMIGMAASMGPAVATVAGVALAVKGVVDLTTKGQDEAKKWQQAFLVMTANGVKNLDQVAASINDITVNGSRAEKMFSRAELAGAMAELARGGVKGSEALKTLAVSAQLAAAEHIPLNEATERLYANLQHLDMGGDQAASFGDKLARASHMSLASMDNLSKGLNVVGQTAHTLGFSVDETLAMLVSLAKKGMDPATIGATGLRNAMQMIIKPGKDAQAIYAELGVKLKDANGHARSGRDIYMDLRDVFSTSGPIYRQAGANMGQLITQTDLAAMGFKVLGTRSATAFLSTRGNIQELTDEVRDSSGFLTKYADTTVGGLEGAQKRLDAATKNLSLSFAKTFTPALASAAELMTKFVNAIDPAVQKLSKLLDLVNSAKTTKEMALAFKITPADSDSEAAFKFFAGGVWGTGKVINTVASISNPFKLPAQARSVELQNELISLGVLKTKPTAAETYKERDYIAAHIPEFEAMLNKALATHKIEIPKTSNLVLPNNPINRDFPGVGPIMPGQPRAGEISSLEQLQTFLGMYGHRRGTPFGEKYGPNGSWGKHVGEDFFATPGTPVYAPFTGTARLRPNDKAQGNIVDLYDANGMRLSMIHLQGYANDFVQAIKDTGGKLKVAQGTLLAYVGQTGTAANAQYGVKNAHLHVHAYGPGGLTNVDNVTWRGMDNGGAWGGGSVGTPETEAHAASTASQRPHPDNTDWVARARQLMEVYQVAVREGNGKLAAHLNNEIAAFKKAHADAWKAAADIAKKGSDTIAPLSVQQITKAQQLTAALKAAQDAHDPRKIDAATLALNKWSKASESNARAIQAVQSAESGLSKKQGEYIASQKDLSRYSNDALKLIKAREAAEQSGDATKIASSQRAVTLWQGESKARAAVMQVEEAAYRSRQQLAAKAQQDSQRSAQEAAQHAQQQAQLTKTLNQQLASGQLENAQATVAQMQQTLETRLSALKDDAAARLQVEKTVGQQVLAAQKHVLEQQRDQAIQAAHDTANTQRAALASEYGKGKEPANLLKQINATEVSQVSAAKKTFDAANSSAYLELQGRINDAQAKVNDGIEKQSQKVRDLRDKYSSLADDLRQKIEDGSVTQKDIESASRKLADLDKDSQTAELVSNRFIQSSRSGVAAVLQAAQANSQALEANKSAEDVLKSRADALQDVLDSTVKLFNSGDTLEEQAQSRSDALGQLASGLSALSGVNLQPETLNGFQTLSDLYDHLTKSGADLQNMDLNGLEQLFQTYQGMSSRNADFLPLDQAKALYDQLVKVGVAGKDAMEVLDGSKYSDVQRGELFMGYQALGDPEHKRSTLAAIQQELAGESLADSPLLLDLQKKLEAELAQMDKVIEGRRKEAQAKIDEIKRQQLMTDLEARKDYLGPVGYQRQHEQLAKKLENEAWARQQKELADREATDTEIQEAQLEHEGRLTAITRQGNQERFDLQQQAAQRTLNAKRAADDAVVRLAQTELERQHTAGLISESDYLQKRYDMQVQGAQQANTRAVQDASKTVLDPTTRKTHVVVDKNAITQANAAQTQAQTEATNERGAGMAALTLRNSRALEDALTAQEQATLEDRHQQHLVSEAEYQRQSEAAQVVAAKRRHARAVEDAHDDADAIKAAGIQLETDLASIAAKGVADRQSINSLSGWQTAINQLGEDFAARKITAQQFTEQLRSLNPQLLKMAQTAAKAGDPKTAQGFRDLAASLHAMTPAVAATLQKMDKLQEYLGNIGQVTGALGTLAGAMGETEQEYSSLTGEKLQTPWKDLAANIQGAQTAIQTVMSMAKDVGKLVASGGSDIGAWVSLITTAVSSIGNALSGYQKQKAQLAQVKDDFTTQNPLLNAGDYQKAYLKSKGFFGNIFGGGPTVVNEIDKIGLKFAQTMQSAFTEGISNGLEQAISQNDFSQFSKTLHESVYKGLEQGIIDTFLNDTLLKNIVGPAIKQWSDALKSGDQGQMAAALTGIDAAMSQVDTQANAFYAQVAPKLQQYRSEWQIDTSSSGGNVNTNDLRTLPEPVQFALATPLLDGVNGLKDAAATLQEAAGSIRDTFKDGIKVVVQQGGTTYTSTTGALAGV